MGAIAPHKRRVSLSSIAGILCALVCLGALTPASSAPAPSSEAFILTTNRIMRVDLGSLRVVASRAVLPEAGRKVVREGALVFLQRRRTVEILDPRTLHSIGTIEFPEDVRDIAAGGSLLFVATGRDVQILRVGPDGRTARQKRVRFAKPADALTARGSLLYVIDDFATPLYAHLIDVGRPGAPRITSIQWTDTNAHLQAQTVADRWYILVSYTTVQERGQYLAILPLGPPLRELGRRGIALERKPVTASTPPQRFIDEFRVPRNDLHGPMLFGIARADDRVSLVARALDPVKAEMSHQLGLGSGRDFSPERRGVIDLVGSRLYVAAASTLLAIDVSTPSSRLVRFEAQAPIVSFAVTDSGK